MSPTDVDTNEVFCPAEDNDIVTDEATVPNDDATVPVDDSKFRKLYIDGLPLTTGESEIRNYFEKWGAIEECILTSTTSILCCLTFAFPAPIDNIQASRPHRIGSTVVETRRILPDSQPLKKLYVGSIKGGTTTGHIFAAFSCFGRVRAVDMIKDKVTGRCRGFCFVSFDDYDSADKCLLKLPIVLNRKVVRVQKAIPISEMIKASLGSEDSCNKNLKQRFPSTQRSESYYEQRKSTSSTDSDFSQGSSVFENPFDHVPLGCIPGGYLPRNDTVFCNAQPVRRWSCPAPTPYAGYPMVNCQPPSMRVRNCSYKSETNNLKAPYPCPALLIPYLNNSTQSLQCPVYSDTFAPNASPQNGYPLSYNIACSNMPDRNLCLPFVFKHNQNVPYAPLPTAPMFVPVSTMCNYSKPGFVGSYQNAYV